MYVSSPKSPQEFFLLNFLVNFSRSTVWKGLLFVYASAFYEKAVIVVVDIVEMREL